MTKLQKEIVWVCIDKPWSNKEGNESVLKHRTICWSKVAVYIYLWLIGQLIGNYIKHWMFEHIKCSPFFPHNNQVSHLTEAETGGKICFLLLCYALNMLKIWVLPVVSSFIECGYWFISNYYFLIRQIQKVYHVPISN